MQNHEKSALYLSASIFSEMMSKGTTEEVATLICEQLREMTGAMTSAYVFQSDNEFHDQKLLYVCPPRRHELVEEFCNSHFHEIEDCKNIWIDSQTTTDPSFQKILQSLQADNLLLVFLEISQEHRGTVILINLVDQNHATEVVNMMDIMGPSIALCIDNCRAREVILRQNKELEQRVAERTKDLAEKNKELEAANNAKTEFLSIMSHEMRTPLNPILGFTQLMLEDERDEQDILYLETILESATRQLKLVDNILNFSRLDNSPVVPKFAKFNLSDLLDQAYHKLKSSDSDLSYLRSTLLGTEPIDSNLIVRSDKGMIEQILDNLLTNAQKYTKKGTVTLKYGLVPIEDSSKTRYRTLHVEVEDTGIGIDPKLKKSIFQPFQQSNTSYTREFEGAGLGLAICKKLIYLLKGEISFRSNGESTSEEKNGTTFYFKIPVETMAVETGSSKFHLRRKHKKRFSMPLKILCVEDNPQNMEFITSIISNFGGEAIQASNGIVAVEKSQHDRYDRILMDLSMPKMDGFEATKRIRTTQGPNKTTPIYALTADLSYSTRLKCEKIGFDQYLTKPVSSNTLFELLEKNRV